ncbi:MAG: lipopolysaccharide biosynthesis protein [Oscillospiraceae bacterium]|jgi:O-antigen/teichoic acid export membrane protein
MEINRKYNKLVHDTTAFFISNFASKLLVYIMLPLYTAVLSGAEYGVADAISTMVNLMSPILTFAISEAVLRLTFQYTKERNEILTHALATVLGSTAILALCKPLMQLAGASFINHWLLFILCYLSYNLQLCFSYYVRAVGKTRLVAVSGVIQTATLMGCNVLFLLVWEMGLRGYLLALVLGNLMSMLVLFFGSDIVIRLKKPKWNMVLFRQMMRYSVPMIPTILAWWLNTSINKYIIAFTLGIAARGLFAIAYKIPSLLTTVASIFTDAWRLSAYDGKDENPSAFFSPIYHFLNILCICVCAGLILLSEFMGKILFSNEFFSAWTCVPFLLIAFLFSALCGFLASMFTREKKTSKLVVSTGVGAAVNLIASVAMVQSLGIIAGAIATCLSFFATWLVRLAQSQKICRMEIDYRRSVPSYLCLVIMAAVMTAAVPSRYIVSVILCVIIGAINFRDIKNICKVLLGLIKNFLRRKPAGQG